MYNNQYMLNSLNREKQKIEDMIQSYQNQPQPVNNFINTNQPQMPTRDLVEWRILNENEEVDNLYVSNKTLFINDNMMVLKGVDGSLEKWEIKKVYPIDKKDEKINALEEEVRKLKEMINNEPTKSIKSTRECDKPDGNVDVDAKPKSKTDSKSVPKED